MNKFLCLLVLALWPAIAFAEPPGSGETSANTVPSLVGPRVAAADMKNGVLGVRVAAALDALSKHPLSPKGMGFRVAQIALDFLGVKYLWGGMSAEMGMDCSGFVKTVYALCGIDLPRTSAEQYRQGAPVERSELHVGDLVFFGQDQVNHVGIYLGEGKFIHAPQPKETIRITSLEEVSGRHKFLGARRLLFD
jgi:cell wall-associated NlpC family hydrolase